jgi:7-cyano-7-deazaguanine synthase
MPLGRVKMLRSIVLLSSGLDSTVNFQVARNESTVTLALTFNYGQRAAAREMDRAQRMCEGAGVPHRGIDLPWLGEITQTALVNEGKELPAPSDLDDPEGGLRSAEAVWVPNRNGVFLNVAAAFAESVGASMIVVGFNAEEARTFPDNSPQFISQANKFFSLSTLSKPKVVCYTADLDKEAIVRLGRETGAPFEYIWPCYRGGGDLCRECESCRRTFRALEAAGATAWFEETRFRHDR